MYKAVIFDMFETLITLHNTPLSQGKQIALEAGIPEAKFREIWDASEEERTLGKTTVETVIEKILKTNDCYSDTLFETIITKRKNVTKECFNHLHPQINEMMTTLKNNGLKTALISNCFFEERDAIRESPLWHYFDAACLSCELGLMKPDLRIFRYSISQLGVLPEECLYVGDGGSHELEAAREAGMTSMQACWYLKDGTNQPAKRKDDYVHLESPLDVVSVCCND